MLTFIIAPLSDTHLTQGEEKSSPVKWLLALMTWSQAVKRGENKGKRGGGVTCNNILEVKIYNWKILPSEVMGTLWSRQQT